MEGWSKYEEVQPELGSTVTVMYSGKIITSVYKVWDPLSPEPVPAFDFDPSGRVKPMYWKY